MKIFNADLSAVLAAVLFIFVVIECSISAVFWERGKKKIAAGLFCMTFVIAVCFLVTIIFGAVNWGW